MRGRQFVVEHLHLPLRMEEEITVEALELAINLLGVDDLFDLVNRRGVTLGRDARALFTKETFKLVEAIIERVRQMRGGARGHAAARGAVVKYDDAAARAREQVGG